MDVGGDGSEDEEPAAAAYAHDIPTAAFLECPMGIPAEYFNPIEANMLEASVMADTPHGLDMLHYLRNGYAVYLRWLKDKARMVGMSAVWDDYLTFSVARSINRDERDGPMGRDIELVAFVHSFPPGEKVAEHIATQCRATLECIRDALSKDPTMTTDDFYARLKHVPEQVLDGHSQKAWRGTEGTVSSGDFAISLEDLETGKCVTPACGFHLGLRMLEENGFLDPVPDAREYRKSRNILHQH